jgi:glycosyltransferase involved in cell wall biosynthesis
LKPGAGAQHVSFSIVVPTFNRSQRLVQTVRSVLDQSLADFELIIVDDGSTDQTIELLGRINDGRIQVLHQSNQGASAARNAGATRATGQWLVFLDDDNAVLPGWLEQFRRLATDPQCGIVCCGVEVVDGVGAVLSVELPRNQGLVFENQTGFFVAGTFAMRRTLFDDVDGYAPELRAGETTELAFRLVPHCLDAGYEIRSVPQPGIKIEQRDSAGRPSQDPSNLYAGALYMLEHHEDRIARYPSALSSYLSIAGINAMRLGRNRDARRFLVRAAKNDPRNLKCWARLTLATLPFVRNRVWRRAKGT